MHDADAAGRVATARELNLPILTWAEVSTVVGASLGGHGLILTESEVAPEFFDLRSGLAGEVFQKFTNYRVPVALVIPDFAVYGERFAERDHERRRHPLICFVHSEVGARTWLKTLD